jgi:hypothetical protein
MMHGHLFIVRWNKEGEFEEKNKSILINLCEDDCFRKKSLKKIFRVTNLKPVSALVREEVKYKLIKLMIQNTFKRKKLFFVNLRL